MKAVPISAQKHDKMNKAELQEVKIHHNNEAQYKENIANLK